MKSMTVGALKRNFSSVLEAVRRGESIIVEYGRTHEEVAVLVPFREYGAARGDRPLGLLAKQGSVRFDPDFSLSDEELLES